MAKRKIDKPEQVLVICSECCEFVRDTSGISRSFDGIYFMGRCRHEEYKVFADRPHECKNFKK